MQTPVIDVQFQNPNEASYYTAGKIGEPGFCDWILIGAQFDRSVNLGVRDPAFARQLESAARQCAEAMEAREKIDEAIEAQGKLTDHESATGNEHEAAE